MADIELAIKINEQLVKIAQRELVMGGDMPTIANAISNGVVLPKGHGRILDVDKLMDELIRKRVIDDGYIEKWIQEYIDNDAEIIIEADKESED